MMTLRTDILSGTRPLWPAPPSGRRGASRGRIWEIQSAKNSGNELPEVIENKERALKNKAKTNSILNAKSVQSPRLRPNLRVEIRKPKGGGRGLHRFRIGSDERRRSGEKSSLVPGYRQSVLARAMPPALGLGNLSPARHFGCRLVSRKPESPRRRS